MRHLRSLALLLALLSLLGIAAGCTVDNPFSKDGSPTEPKPPAALPAADFNWREVGNAAIQFSNRSTNATSYTWTFGDGSRSVDSSPTHTYDTLGQYPVKLTACNSDGVCDTRERIVNVTGGTF